MIKKVLITVLFFFGLIFSASSVNAFPASDNNLIDGIDVSEWQETIDFAEVRDSRNRNSIY